MTSLSPVTNDPPDETQNSTAVQNDFLLLPEVFVTFCILYATIFVLGIFGNVLVCYVVARNRNMQTVTNLFITNLALSDILMCVLAVPFTPLYTFLGRWVFGELVCHLLPYTQGVSIYISTLTLTGIAVDRFFIIVYPFQPKMRVEVCVRVIVGIWLVSLLVTLPYGIFVELEDPYFCEEHWPSEDFRMVFSSLTTIFQFVVPFLVIALCYVCVSMRLKSRARSKPGSKSSRKEEAEKERMKRTNRMLIGMVAIFGVCWLPLNIVNILDDFFPDVSEWHYYRLCFFLSHCLAMSSTCYNPFLYAWLNDNFRKEFKQVLPCFKRPSMVSFAMKPTSGCRRELGSNGDDTVEDNLLSSQRSKLGPPISSGVVTMDSTDTATSKDEQSVQTESKQFADIEL